MATIFTILLASFGLVYGGLDGASFASEGAPPHFGSAGEGSTGIYIKNENPHFSGIARFGRRGSRFQGVIQQEGFMFHHGAGASEHLARVQIPQGSFLQLQSDLDKSDSSESEELGESSASPGGSHHEKNKESPQAGSAHEEDHEATPASKREAATSASEDSKSSAAEEEENQTSSEEHLSHSAAGASSKDHAEGKGGSSETASHKEEEEQGNTSHELSHGNKGISEHAKEKHHESGHEGKGMTEHEEAKAHEPSHKEHGITDHEKESAHESAHTAERTSKHEKPKPHEAGHKAEGISAHEEKKAKGHKPEHGTAEVSQDAEFNTLIDRLRPLLRSAKGKELYGKLVTIVDLHERRVEAEEELKEEAKKEEAQEEVVKDKPLANAAVKEDLLLTQQLSNMWALPFYEEAKRETCLSGFEKLVHEATITCSDPECFKLETQAQQCHYMSISSIMRKEDFDAQTGQPAGAQKPHPHVAKDHMLLGFDGECRKPESLGSEILSMLQHPKSLAKKHALERSTGNGGTVPLQKHHLDIVCDNDEKAEYPSCKTVYEALQHVAEPKPRALPELLVLTDIKDLKNTLGLYRITFLFEGLVQFATPDGTKVDASKHKLPAQEAEFMRKHRHQDISATVMLKAE